MSKFRVAFSGDYIRPDGGRSFPSADLTAFDSDSRIEYEFLTSKLSFD